MQSTSWLVQAILLSLPPMIHRRTFQVESGRGLTVEAGGTRCSVYDERPRVRDRNDLLHSPWATNTVRLLPSHF